MMGLQLIRALLLQGPREIRIPGHPENLLRGGEILLTALYLLVYGYWARKLGLWDALESTSMDVIVKWKGLFFT